MTDLSTHRWTGLRGMTRRGWVVLFGGVVALGLGGCGMIWPSDQLRQRITVEVETPAGLRSGSSVVETEVKEGKSWGDASGTSFTLKGEAVAVDLPGGRTLFALLHGASDTGGDAAGYQTRLLYEALNAGAVASVPVSVEGLDVMQARAAAKRADVSLTLPDKLHPMLVTFADIADPKSVERVDPANLAASFGPGVTLRRITVELTDEPVTTGIRQRLAWLESQRGSLRMDALNAPPPPGTPLPFGANLSEGDFTQGMSR